MFHRGTPKPASACESHSCRFEEGGLKAARSANAADHARNTSQAKKETQKIGWTTEYGVTQPEFRKGLAQKSGG